MLVSGNPEVTRVRARVPQLRQARLCACTGLNFRMNEFTAAIGLVQTSGSTRSSRGRTRRRAPSSTRSTAHGSELPDGMTSGLYKYIVFEPIERSTGKVYDEPCHRVLGKPVDLPNSDWVAENHWCVPLYYRPNHARRRCNEGARHRRRRASSARMSSTGCRRRAIEPRIFDLVPSPHHRAGEVETVLGDLCDSRRRPRRARRAATRSSTSPRSPTSTRSRRIPRAPTASTSAARRRSSRPRASSRSPASSTRARSGSTATQPVPRRSTRTPRSGSRSTSTPRPRSPARCTRRPTPSCTGSSTRSCASASRTGRARGRPRWLPRSPPRRSRASR